MNKYAIYHKPDSEYAYPLDKNTLRLVLKAARGEKFKEVSVLWNNKYDFAKLRNFTRMRKLCSDELYDYYVCDLWSADARFAYVFLLTLPDDEEYYFSEEGVSTEYDFKHGYYTFFQFPFINAADVITPAAWTANAVFYQIFPDRFRRGDFTKEDGYITQGWDALPKPRSYAGGDIKGILEKLDMIKGMGFSALYLTPLFKAPSNHKYNVADYLTVDPMFGTNEDLYALIHAAHARGIKLVIDAVFNHCSEENEKFLDVRKKGKSSAYYDWFIIHGDFPEKYEGRRCNYEIFADCPYMPKWNTSNPEVREHLTGIALTYLSWGFDGLRLDVADEVSHTFWRELRQAVKGRFPEAALIGEVWHENGMYLGGDEFDGVMNYKLQKVFADYFALGQIDARKAAERINRIVMKNPSPVNRMMLNFLDNHDTPRFLRLCREDEKRLCAALAALYFSVGMPCVLYGTELPLTGDSDPDCRRTYDWTGKAAYDGYMRQLARLRAELPPGEMYAEEKDGVLILVREGKEERVKAYFGSLKTRGETLFEDENLKIVKEKL